MSQDVSQADRRFHSFTPIPVLIMHLVLRTLFGFFMALKEIITLTCQINEKRFVNISSMISFPRIESINRFPCR